MTREAARLRQGVGSSRAEGGAGPAVHGQAADSRKTGGGDFTRTGRMAEGWGQGGGWVSQEWP